MSVLQTAGTRLEYYSFDAYNEAGNLKMMIERFREREGHYPSRVLADKIYRNRENLRYCKKCGIRLAGPALGRPRKDDHRDKTQDRLDECERIEVERRFSLAKRKCGMGLITARLRETAAHVIAMSCKNRHSSSICTQYEHHPAGVLAPLSRSEAPMPYNWFSTAIL